MIIGIDVDGVLTDLYKCCKKEYSKYSKMVNGRRVFNKNGIGLAEVFGLSYEKDVALWNDFSIIYSQNEIFYSLAKKYTKKLKEDGHTLYIVTSRHYAGRDDELGKNMRDNLFKSLKRAGITYDKVFFTSHKGSKTDTLIELKADVMIDDSAFNLDEISKKLPCICYRQIYNKNYKKDNVIMAKNWKEIYKIITEMAVKK